MIDESVSDNTMQLKLERLRNYAQQDPRNLNLMAELADLAMAARKFEVARGAVGRALALQPDDPYFRLRLSSIALAEGLAEEASAITSELLAEGHGDAAIRFNHAYALVLQGEYEEALGLLEQLRVEGAPFANIAGLTMRCLHYLGRLESAIEVGLAHMQARPNDYICAGMLSLLYFDINDFGQAEYWAKYSLDGGEDNIDALLAAGGAALGAENPTEAKMFLHRAIDLQPSNGRAWTSLGLVDMLDSNLAGAEQKLSQAAQYMPGHLGTWVALGWTQLMQGNPDAAEASFDRALALDDTFAETHSGLAAVAAVRGDMQQAEAHAKTARRLDPSSMSYQYPQLVKLYREGRGEDAARLVRAALQRGQAPGGGSLLDMAERLAVKKKRS